MNAPNSNMFYSISVPGDSSSLSLVRVLITHLAEDIGFPEDDIGQIEIAVDEACTNVIEHAYNSISPKPPVKIDIQTMQDQLIIDILDEGKPFDYSTHIMPTFPDHWNEGNIRGVGLFIIKQCMDESTYTQLPDNTNRLRLVKKLSHIS